MLLPSGMAATLENGSFYGRAGTPLRVGDVVLTETTYRADFVVPMHSHAHPFFCLPLEGAFVEHVDRTRRVLQPRTAFYHPSGHDHAETFEHGPARLFNIQLGAEWLSRLASFDVGLPEHHIALPHGRASAVGLHLHDEYRLGGERLIVDGLLLTLVGEVNRWRRIRERGRVPGWMSSVVDALRSGVAFDLAGLVAVAGVDPAHLVRTFRRVHGCTPGVYARRLKVARARELLVGTGWPLARIAVQCGFADQSHFTRVFRREVGVTPGVYRRMVASRRSRTVFEDTEVLDY